MPLQLRSISCEVLVRPMYLCGIVDPVGSDMARVFGRDRTSRPYALAAALLTGADPYGMDFLEAFRAGELAGEF